MKNSKWKQGIGHNGRAFYYCMPSSEHIDEARLFFKVIADIKNNSTDFFKPRKDPKHTITIIA